MGLFSRIYGNKQKKHTIIIGCGRFGAALAGSLSAEGQDVIVIDKDKDAFKRLSADYSGSAVHGDGTAIETLNCSGIGCADTLIAATDDDNINVMAAQLAQHEMSCGRVIARVSDDSKECIYSALGIETFRPAQISAGAVEKMLSPISA